MSRLFLIISFVFFAHTVVAGPNTVTKHYNVNGVCKQCKARIENAAYIKGVKFAEWNVDTHDLTIKYDSTKTSPEVFLKSIADAGHDNDLFKADDAVYGKIHHCCRYRPENKK